MTALAVITMGFVLGGAPTPRMPHPAPQQRARPVSNAECEACHADVAAEWRRSLHHTSFSDADYQRAIVREPDPFCTSCHAPERDPALGVACVTCHVPDDTVLAVPGTRTAPHALVRTPAFATESACAQCHEFDFPDARLRQRPLPMQRTITEHRARGRDREGSCATCHMPRQGGHADHTFAASRDASFVKSAVDVRARRTSPRTVEVTLSPARVGHAFPTGDLFRRVKVSAGSATRFLARHYANRQEIAGLVVRAEVGDDRVQDGDRVVVLEAPGPKTLVRVVYERAEGPSGTSTSSATVAGAITLFEDEL